MLFACSWQSSAQLAPAALIPAVPLPQQELLPLKFPPGDPQSPPASLTREVRKGCVGAGWFGAKHMPGATSTKTGQELGRFSVV